MSAAPQPEPPLAGTIGHAKPVIGPSIIEGPTPPPVEEGAPTWVVTFGDLMSLLLTFFILLFSMSEIEVEKFRMAVNSLHEGFGESTIDLGDVFPPGIANADELSAYLSLAEYASDLGAGGTLDLIVIPEPTSMTIAWLAIVGFALLLRRSPD